MDKRVIGAAPDPLGRGERRPRVDLGRIGVAAVAPGVWRVALPFPSPLGYSYCYFLEFDHGFLAIDLGWNSDTAFDLFVHGLAMAGGTLEDLRGVVITHAHADHYGLADRLREVSAAWIAMHPAEQASVVRTDADAAAQLGRLNDWYAACGVPTADSKTLQDQAVAIIREINPHTGPDRLIADGAEVPETAGRLRAIHTPGHTPGHLCFEDRDTRLLFTGDHVLPRVTVNVSQYPLSGPDPLRDYLDSLLRLRNRPVELIQPGHEWSFDRLSGRLDAITRHHAERLSDIESAVRTGRDTVWDVAATLPWGRPFASFDASAIRAALGETYAHLTRLARSGRIAERAGRPITWQAATVDNLSDHDNEPAASTTRP